MAEVRESTPDQTPGPSHACWMEGGGTVRLHHQRQLGLYIYCARGICMRTLRNEMWWLFCTHHEALPLYTTEAQVLSVTH